MNQYDNWEELPPDVKRKLIEEEKKTLAKIKLIYFRGSPSEVEPFSSSTLSWEVDANDVVAFQLELNGNKVDLQGTMEVSPFVNTSYKLVAVGSITQTGRVLGTVTVNVNTESCFVYELGSYFINESAEDRIRSIVGANSRLKERGAPSAILTSKGIAFTIPLELDVPHWWNAKLDISFLYRINLNVNENSSRLLASLSDLSVDISWEWWKEALGHGYATVIRKSVEETMHAFLDIILGHYMKAEIEAELNNTVYEAARTEGIENARITNLVKRDEVWTFTICPGPRS